MWAVLVPLLLGLLLSGCFSPFQTDFCHWSQDMQIEGCSVHDFPRCIEHCTSAAAKEPPRGVLQGNLPGLGKNVSAFRNADRHIWMR